jgi:indole-3-glycerol phosphate synthase
VDFLADIARDRRRRIEEMRRERPESLLRGMLAPGREAGRLERALGPAPPAPPRRKLCEVKRASPSKGVLHDTVDPVATARLYERGGAAAVSLVTEPDHFRGDPRWMDAVRPRVALPLLLKDFVLDPYQLLDAAARGADAVLLLAALLDAARMAELLEAARTLGLDALVEVHDEAELDAALAAGARIVGINNRSLHTFEVDLGTSLALLPRIPAGHVAVAESGLSRPEDLLRLRQSRCDAVLMGEVFMTSADPAATLARLGAAARGDDPGVPAAP